MQCFSLYCFISLAAFLFKSKVLAPAPESPPAPRVLSVDLNLLRSAESVMDARGQSANNALQRLSARLQLSIPLPFTLRPALPPPCIYCHFPVIDESLTFSISGRLLSEKNFIVSREEPVSVSKGRVSTPHCVCSFHT